LKKRTVILLLVLFLTILTQIGGLVYLISIFLLKKQTKKRKQKQLGLFIGLYLTTTFLLIPNIAPFYGREKIEETNTIQAHSFIYKLANRNYVRPELNKVLKKIASELKNNHPGIKLIYLDANFPFFNKFPLLPHLSHNDGKKIDASLLYENTNSELINKKPSISGYGVFENPTQKEQQQTNRCKEKGYWQYDFSKYFTFGEINKEIKFSNKGTASLIKIIANQDEVEKIFIEPHLKNRLHLTNPKIRFHGCKAVRHDDHIHFQIK